MAMFLVFRFFAGAGAFMILAAVPIWMAEVVPPYLRGALVQLHAIILVIGYMTASWLGYGLYISSAGGIDLWRIPFALQCFLPALPPLRPLLVPRVSPLADPARPPRGSQENHHSPP